MNANPIHPGWLEREKLLRDVPENWADAIRQKVEPLRRYGWNGFDAGVEYTRDVVAELDNLVLPANATDADINDHAAARVRRVREIISLPCSSASLHDSLNRHCINNRIPPPN